MTAAKVIRAPLIWGGVILSLLILGPFLSWVTIGGWLQNRIESTGAILPDRAYLTAGTTIYITLGVIVPGHLLFLVIGPSGILIGPYLIVILIGYFARW
jgi:hypothetical protein